MGKGKGGDAHQRAIDKQRVKGAVEETIQPLVTPPPAPDISLGYGQKLMDFIESPWFTVPLGIIGGLVGLLLFTPVLAICELSIILGFHRQRVVGGMPLKKQIGAYAALILITAPLLWGAKKVIDHSVHLPTASEFADAVIAKLPHKQEVQQTPVRSVPVTPKEKPIHPLNLPIPGQRTLTDWQIVRIKAQLSKFPGQKLAIVASAGKETHQYAMQFKEVLISIHWNVIGPLDAPIDQEFSDLQVSINNNWDYAVNGKIPVSIQTFRGVLDDSQLKVRPQYVLDPEVQTGIIALLVGGKSPDNVSTERYPPLSIERPITDSLFAFHSSRRR